MRARCKSLVRSLEPPAIICRNHPRCGPNAMPKGSTPIRRRPLLFVPYCYQCVTLSHGESPSTFRQQAWARIKIALHRHARFAGYRWCLCSLSPEPRHLLNWTFSDVSPVATCAQPSKRRTPTTRLLEYAQVSLIRRGRSERCPCSIVGSTSLMG